MSLMEYFKEADINFDQNLIKINENPYSIEAVVDIEPGVTIVSIPKDSVLSIKTTAIADLFEEEELDGTLALTIAAMYEHSLGKKSPWYTYLSTLPEHVHIPLFYSAEELEMFKGTDVYKEIENDKRNLWEDFNSIVVPILEKLKLEANYDTFLKVFSWVVSRSFETDAYHGESLVPFADLFNHKTDGEHVHLEHDGDVCFSCGALDSCDCFEDENESEEWTDDEMQEIEDAEEIPELAFAEDESTMQAIPPPQVLEMVTIKSCKKGEQLFNTYGQHPNTFLLKRYGFAEENNPYSTVKIERSWLIDNEDQERIEAWEKLVLPLCVLIKREEDEPEQSDDEHEHMHEHGDDECNDCDIAHEDHDEEHACEDEDCQGCSEIPEDFEIMANGRPNLQLAAFLTLLSMDPEAFKTFYHDADACIKGLVSLRDNVPKIAKLVQVCEYRLSLYPDIKVHGYAKIIRDQEIDILRKCIETNK